MDLITTVNVPAKVTVSRITLLRGILLSWILGLCFGHLLGFSPWWALCLVSVAMLSALPLRHSLPWKAVGLFAMSFYLATVRFSLAIPPSIIDPSRIEAHMGEVVILTGTIVETSSPDGKSSRFVLVTSSPYSGRVYVRSDRPLEGRYGEIVEVSGTLEKPLDFTPEFSWRAYLEGRGIGAVMIDPSIVPTGRYGRSIILRSFDALRSRISEDIAILLPHRSAALLAGILMGNKAPFSQSFLNDLQATGLTHIVALSGFNITILIAFVTGLLLRSVGRYARFVLSIIVILAFILLVGPSASVIRAAIMGLITLLALTVGRRADALNMLLLALVVMTTYEPRWLFIDMGFQLSFLATLGIVLLVPLSRPFLPGKKGLRMLCEALFATLAAQIATLPFLLQHFGTVSIIAPIANLLVVSLVPLIMLLGSIAVFLGLIPLLDPLSQAFGFLAYLPLAYVENTVALLAHLPLASLDITWWNGYWTLASYAFIAVAYVAIRRKLPIAKG